MQKTNPNTEGNPKKDYSRREFIATAASGFVAISMIGISGVNFFKSAVTPIERESSGVIFPDPTLCIGCLTCEVACSDAHRQVGMSTVSRIRIFNEPNVKLDPEITKNYPGRGSFIQQPCLQCPDSPCLPVCPVNALLVEPKTGARVINEKTCIACGRCAEACPFPVRAETIATNELTVGQKTRITYDPQKNVFTKCDLCYFREEGPACVQKCPINVRIKQGIVKSDHLCLNLPKSDKAQFSKMKEQQTVNKS
ncbi:MAG: 4Fe-4S dicluster domain-containing protein [Chloroflexi bacterium]|nr:4Fe-4S dicluster domain-containing protein [Chloroflexota bacterium]